MEQPRKPSHKATKRRSALEPNVVLAPEEGIPAGPSATVSAAPLPPSGAKVGEPLRQASSALEQRLRQKRAEVLILKAEAFGLAQQLENLEDEYTHKRRELRRAWQAAKRKIRTLGVAIDAEEAAHGLLAQP